MRTVVYQSYRTSNVAPWVLRCMESVRQWAGERGFEYRFVDDTMFDYVPAWYKKKARGNILLIADLGRLELAKELLATGADRTIWVDADVFVIDPGTFSVDVESEYAFCREVWLHKPEVFGITLPLVRVNEKVNNAVTVFTRNNTMLDFYAKACLSLVENMPGRFDPGYASTTFLTWLHGRVPLPLLNNVALLSPPILQDISNGGGRYARLFMKKFAHRVEAVNLCGTFNNGHYMGVTMSNSVYDAAIDALSESKGHELNRYLRDSEILPSENDFRILEPEDSRA